MIRQSRTRLRRTSLALATMLAIGASTAFAANGLSLGQASVALGAPTSLRPTDTIMGPLASTQPVHIVVALKLRNADALNSFISGAQSSVVTERPTMSAQQLEAQHLPTAVQAQAVANFLNGAGFQNVQIADNRMLVSADAPAAIAQSAFATSLVGVKTADGRMAYANNDAVHIPAALQDTVLSVIGLQTVHQAHTMVKPQIGPQPQAVTGHNPTEFASIYGGSGQTTGAGVAVGIITQGSLTNVKNDLNSFTSQNGLATVTTQTVQTGSTSTDTSGDGEWDLDSQDIVGMAGGTVGKIIFYNEGTLSNSDLTANVNTAVSQNATKIINMSLGECETSAQGDGSAAAQDQSFATAVAQGQTFSISTGDSGADECSNGGTTPSWPAASQYVIAVAGTTLNASTTTWSSETVWSGSGGSQSTFEPKPSWQTLWSGAKRGVADVAFDADPNSGAKVIVDGASQQIGGTSLAAPLFSGLWSRVIAAKGSSVGFAGPLIYQLPASSFHDVTSGSNGISAGVGYDLASGRGSLIISSALANIGGGGGGNVPPTANFSFTTSGLTANFTDSSTDSDGTIASRSWNFGDSTTSTATNPSHTYATAGTYSVTETVTDNGGATNSKTSSVTVSSGGGGGSVLSNGVGVSISDATVNHQQNWTMVVPAGATNLVFSMSGGTGDADMYVRFGSAPTLTTYDCRPYVTGNAETCTISNVQAGTYYVMVNAYAAYSGVTLKGSYSTGGGGGNVLQSGVPVTGLSATTGNFGPIYTMAVPAGKTKVTFTITGSTGDADLYVRIGAAPTTTTYSCRPYLTGDNETCTFNAPTAGTYYVGVRAYSTYSGVTLTGTIQ